MKKKHAPSLLLMFQKLFIRELLLYWRKPTLYLQPLLFFALVIVSFPFTLNEDSFKLAILAAPITWFASLLAVMISLETLWSNEAQDGSLDQLFLAGIPLTLLAYIKTLCHWLVIGLPILILLPFILLLYQIAITQLFTYVVAFLLGTLSMSFLGGMIATLLLRAKYARLLLPSILLPLFIPLTILVNAAIYANMLNAANEPVLLLLLAFFVFVFTLCPLVSAYILRITAL